MEQEFVTLPREVVEQALEALINEGEFRKLLKPLIEKSIDSIRAALEQPRGEQEPVAWLTIEVMGPRTKVDVEWEDQLQKLPSGIYKLYTHPQPRQPLTEEKIWELYCDWHGEPDGCYGFARAIEAAHNIK